jgi:ABC-type uncharacterized transport system auxiliary subunit
MRRGRQPAEAGAGEDRTELRECASAQCRERPLEQLNAEYRLELSIRSFQITLQPSPKAVVDVTARLVSDKGAIAGARAFTASVAANSTEAADAVAALNEAFAKGGRRDCGLTAGTI